MFQSYDPLCCEVRPSRAQRHSELGYYLQAEIIEQQILSLIESDPVGAAKSWIGRAHLQRFWWLLGSYPVACAAANCELLMIKPTEKYPWVFELGDVLVEGAWLSAQLVAQEYFERGPETPLALEAMIGLRLDGKPKHSPADPFEVDDRPAVTVELRQGERVETVRLDGGSPGTRPAEGFRDA